MTMNHHAHIHLTTSHDTSELCCDSVALWWEHAGRAANPQATRLLVLGDGGGSNSATPYLFKEDLQGLANRLGLEIRVAHYPPYCSKHNPIEHQVFPHITRLPGGDLAYGGHCAAIHRTYEDHDRPARDGTAPGQGVPNRAHICRQFQTQHENRL